MDRHIVASPLEANIHYVFEQMYSQQGKLVAVECLSRLKNQTVSPEDFFHHANALQRKSIFLDQLSLIESYSAWFLARQIIVTVNIDDDILTLFQDSQFIERIRNLRYVHFEVNEHSKSLISDCFPTNTANCPSVFWLDDYGSGYAGIDVIRRYHFHYIKISKETFWFLEKNAFGQHYMRSLLTFLHKNNHHVVIEGVENNHQITWLEGMDWYALQGHYWPALTIEQLVARHPLAE